MHALLIQLSPDLQQKLIKKAMPTFEQPMLATLTKDYFSDKKWIFERKFDGVRCLLFKNGNTVFLKSRNNKSLNASYPELIDAGKKIKTKQIILDGEVVAFKGTATSFEALQSRSGLRNAAQARELNPIYLYVFDILYLDGYELTHVPLMTRKSILKKALTFTDPLRYTVHHPTKGKELFAQACKKKWEGIIAKRRESIYAHKRSPDWLKFKCVANQEMVIGGYTTPRNSRTGFGALLLGYYKEGVLHYAGKVGTGFSQEFLDSFIKELKKLATTKNPFSSSSMVNSTVHFVKPHLVAEIGFEEWTRDNKLRQARFQGLRYDKKARDVVKEEAK